MNLVDTLTDILFRDANDGMWDDRYLKIKKLNTNDYSIECGQMYTSPPLNFSHLKELSDLFGTVKIDVDDFNNSGCETCDFGSNYGHDITLKEVTLHNSVWDGLVGKKNLYTGKKGC